MVSPLEDIRSNRRVMAYTASAMAGAAALDARLGGEEFAVLMPGSDQAGAEAFAERVRRALAASAVPNLPDVRVGAGITATTVPIALELMLDRVDQALYAARHGDRNRTVGFDAPAAWMAA